MSKYKNHEFVKIAEIYDPKVAEFIKLFNKAICLTDDILDRKISSNYALELFHSLYFAMMIAIECKGLLEKINIFILKMLEAERMNLIFIPGSCSVEEELDIWKDRSMVLRLMFEVLCYVDSTFDTETNRKWLESYLFECTKYNDCKDILEETWEDFYQCRRNYVALQMFGFDIYESWRTRKSELIDKAKIVLNETTFPTPEDKRLNMCKGD